MNQWAALAIYAAIPLTMLATIWGLLYWYIARPASAELLATHGRHQATWFTGNDINARWAYCAATLGGCVAYQYSGEVFEMVGVAIGFGGIGWIAGRKLRDHARKQAARSNT